MKTGKQKAKQTKKQKEKQQANAQDDSREFWDSLNLTEEQQLLLLRIRRPPKKEDQDRENETVDDRILLERASEVVVKPINHQAWWLIFCLMLVWLVAVGAASFLLHLVPEKILFPPGPKITDAMDAPWTEWSPCLDFANGLRRKMRKRHAPPGVKYMNIEKLRASGGKLLEKKPCDKETYETSEKSPARPSRKPLRSKKGSSAAVSSAKPAGTRKSYK